jgi:hypothetical protein
MVEARRPPSQIIRQIENHAGLRPCVGQVPLQPEQFRNLHFDRQATAEALQNWIVRAVARVGLVNCPMVHPEHGIQIASAGLRDGKRLASLVTHHKRAGGVEADGKDGG